MEGARAFAECAAVYALLEPEEPDKALEATFARAADRARGVVEAFHGASLADRLIAEARTDWATREDSLAERTELARLLTVCNGALPAEE